MSEDNKTNLTPEEVAEIPKLVESGMLIPQIAEKIGCSNKTVLDWIKKYRKAMKEKGIENPLPIRRGRPPMKLNV